MFLPPRAGVERHVILGALRDMIAELLLEEIDAGGKVPPDQLAQRVVYWTWRCFPTLKPAFGEGVGGACDFVARRYVEHTETFRKVDPEIVLLDALEALGVPRATGHNWLKAAK